MTFKKINTANTNLPPLDDENACIAFAHKINPKKQPLTIEKLRSFPGCEHYSDEEANQLLQSFEKLTAIIFDATTCNLNLCSTEQQVVYLNETTPSIPIHQSLNKAA